ncbi:Cna B-type domain-containing protein, partial [Streptococcus pyogenes]
MNIIQTNPLTFVIKNIKATSVSGQKIWEDQDDQAGIRPVSIRVNLLANGEIVQTKTVTATDDWKYNFTDLPEFESGQKIDYTITEDPVPSYETTV